MVCVYIKFIVTGKKCFMKSKPPHADKVLLHIFLTMFYAFEIEFKENRGIIERWKFELSKFKGLN